MRSFAAREAEYWMHNASDMVASRVLDVDHFGGFMFATMRSFAAREAETWSYNAPDIFAPLAHDVDHFVGSMFAAMRSFAALDAVIWSFDAPDMFAPRMCDVDESTRFAVHRTTCRCLPFPAILRLFLYWETFLAIICHIIIPNT
jgi:hypothetical protein